MLALDSSQQSFFVGIRSTFYRLAMITGQGLLIIIAGSLETWTGVEPMQFKVSSSTTAQTEIVLTDQNHTVPQTDEMTFVAFPQNLVLNTTNIAPDSLTRIKEYVNVKNQENGFVSLEEKSSEVNKAKKSWWSNHVSTPLGDFIKTNFGEKRKLVAGTDGKVGNAGVIAVRLSKKPDEGKTVVLNSSLKSGDKSISIVNGERIVFTTENWDKPAYMVVQLDYKLKKEVTAEFKGVSGNIKLAWSITFFILAGFVILIMIYHRFILPRPVSDVAKVTHTAAEIIKEFGNTFATFFQKPGIGTALAFLLLYRLGEAMLVKMASPFLLDAREVGGLGLTTGQVGIVYGTVGILALTLGGIVGGIAASRKGLKFWIWIMALCITLPHLAFLYLSWFLPENFFVINAAVAFEQFGYGFGFTAYMLFMIYFAEGEHKTAHFAISTGLMALGMMLPGMIAGWLQDMLGYNHFFIFVMICAIPTLAVIPFLKIDKEFGKKTK
jgi:PAT family beta-lactamase induction signal transducer AmpG